MKRTTALAALLLASCSGNGGSPELQISDPWARETVAGQSSTAAYMEITNSGSAADRLVRVSASPPATATLHRSSNEDGISRMRALEELEIAAGETIALQPGGTHVMVEGLPGQVRERDTLRLSLHFERSGERAVEAQVRKAAAAPGAVHPGH